MRYLNRWTALGGWVVLMAIVWAAFVPRAVSVASFVVLVLTGPLAAIVLTILWRSQQPAPSIGQQRVQVEEAETASRAKK